VSSESGQLFEVETPVGFRVRVSTRRWDVIVGEKHPVMRGREERIRFVLESPEEVRRSRHDANVFLFYVQEGPGRWICAVARRNEEDGFLITAYPTDVIKEGTKIWPT